MERLTSESDEPRSLDDYEDVSFIEKHVVKVDNLSQEDRLMLEESGLLVGHPDHDEILRFSVDNWEHVLARVTGLRDGLGDGDGMDVCMEQFAREGSVVEFLVNGEVACQIVHEGGFAMDYTE